MPRGRPKGSKNKPKVSSTSLFSTETNTVEEKKEAPTISLKEVKTPNTTKTGYYICMLCEKQYGGGPIVVNLSLSFGRANYYRETKPDRLHICPNCADELNKLVDDWILKKNPKLSKFPRSS